MLQEQRCAQRKTTAARGRMKEAAAGQTLRRRRMRVHGQKSMAARWLIAMRMMTGHCLTLLLLQQKRLCRKGRRRRRKQPRALTAPGALLPLAEVVALEQLLTILIQHLHAMTPQLQ